MSVAQARELVQRYVTDHPVILIGADLDRLTQHVHELRSMNAERVLVVASGRGPGPVSSLDGYEYVEVDAPAEHGATIVEPAWKRIFASPPTHLREALNAFDPDRNAIVIPWRFRRSRMLGDRPVFGPRMPEATALEDKTRIGPLLAALDIPQPPGAQCVPVVVAALREASAQVNRGAGVVWSGDAATATNSAAKFVRRIRTAHDMEEAYAFFRRYCNEVRVAPFLDGVPCGMHAFVTAQGTAVFRPVELIILRSKTGIGFVDTGFSTTFDPEPDDTAAYRSIVRAVGDELHQQFGYQGAISVDAILTEDGWAVHDINPRPGGGLVYARHALPELPIHLLHHVFTEAARTSESPTVDLAALEHEVVEAADACRMVVAACSTPEGPRRRRTVRVRGVPGQGIDVRYRPLKTGGGRVTFAAVGRPGEQIAPRIAAALGDANETLGLGVALEAARDVRTEMLRIREAEAMSARVLAEPTLRSTDASVGVIPSL